MGSKTPVIIVSVTITGILVAVGSILAWYFLRSTECTPNPIPVHDSLELRWTLRNYKECDEIHLHALNYEIDFALIIKSEVVIKGHGPSKTTLRIRNHKGSDKNVAVLINGSNTSITGVKIILSNDGDWTHGINVVGGGNTLKDIHLEGENKTEDKHGENSLFCVKLEGDKNNMESVTCTNVPNGIFVNGNHNKLTKLHYLNNMKSQESVAVQVEQGSDNLIKDLICEGLTHKEGDWGLRLKPGSKKSKIIDSICGPVWIQGMDSEITNLSARDYIRIEGTGHKLQNVRAKMFTNDAKDSYNDTSIVFDTKTKRYTANNSEQLVEMLGNATAGDTIELGGGTYYLTSNLNVPSGVAVHGVGSISSNSRTRRQINSTNSNHVTTTLKCMYTPRQNQGPPQRCPEVFVVLKDNSEISGLTIVGLGITQHEQHRIGIEVNGSHNTIRDIVLDGHSTACRIFGDSNRVSYSNFTNSSTGLGIRSNGNKLHNLKIDTKEVGIGISGDENELDYVSLISYLGISVDGNRNGIRNIEFQQTYNQKGKFMLIGKGTGNVLDHVGCQGLDHDWENSGVTTSSDSRNCRARNIKCGPVRIDGSGHHLLNVDGGKYMEIRGTGHRLDNCRALKWGFDNNDEHNKNDGHDELEEYEDDG